MKLAGRNLMKLCGLYGLQLGQQIKCSWNKAYCIHKLHAWMCIYIKIQILMLHEVQTVCIISAFPYSKVKEGSAVSLSLSRS